MGLKVSEKEILLIFFPICKSMGANDPLRSGQFGLRGKVGRINVEEHQTLLHTKSVSSGPHGFREEDF